MESDLANPISWMLKERIQLHFFIRVGIYGFILGTSSSKYIDSEANGVADSVKIRTKKFIVVVPP